MANIKSSAKRDEKSKQLRAKNRADKTELKTMMKKFDAAVADGNRDAAVSAYKVAVKTVDRAACKGLLHKNNAAHKKSAMSVKLNEMALVFSNTRTQVISCVLFAFIRSLFI